MAIEAPLSSYKKNTFKIIIVVLISLSIYCVYDGYYNKKFIKTHTFEDVPDSTLLFNKKSPPYLIVGAVLLTGCFFVIRNKKIIADETDITIDGKQKISYESIQKIDKTNFKSKGYFVITYTGEGGKEINKKINDRTYDNLDKILDELVAKIT